MFNKIVLMFLPFALFAGQAEASVILAGTRVVYPESEKEITVKANNTGRNPVLIQSWIDEGNADASPDTLKVPFVIKPPLSRIDAGKGQTLRISYIGGTLPRDRESLFWLNVLEVPSANKSDKARNSLQIAYRTRIKLFFRPDGLSGDNKTAMTSLKWKLTGQGLEARNDSPYFVNLLDIRIKHAGKDSVIDADRVPPFGSATFSLKGTGINKNDALIYDYINDWGALNSVNFTL